VCSTDESEDDIVELALRVAGPPLVVVHAEEAEEGKDDGEDDQKLEGTTKQSRQHAAKEALSLHNSRGGNTDKDRNFLFHERKVDVRVIGVEAAVMRIDQLHAAEEECQGDEEEPEPAQETCESGIDVSRRML
jgi:hypothetical protein